MKKLVASLLLSVGLLSPQTALPPEPQPALQPAQVTFSCPMDPDVRSKLPGKCPKCGMALVPGIPEPVEYRLGVKFFPPQIPAGRKVRIEFQMFDPKTNACIKDFQVVHEKLFHLFVVSEDLQFFLHDHPQLGPAGTFHFEIVLPKPGNYALLADAYPKGGTPQLLSKIFTTAGNKQSLRASIAHLPPDLTPKHTANLDVQVTLDPPQPIAGKKTMMFFRLQPADGVEPYLGAWGHMLAASNDLLDLIHTHPSWVTTPDGSKQIQFDLFFPREATYRVWVQFQRNNQVNTAAFTIPVSSLK